MGQAQSNAAVAPPTPVDLTAIANRTRTGLTCTRELLKQIAQQLTDSPAELGADPPHPSTPLASEIIECEALSHQLATLADEIFERVGQPSNPGGTASGA